MRRERRNFWKELQIAFEIAVDGIMTVFAIIAIIAVVWLFYSYIFEAMGKSPRELFPFPWSLYDFL